MDACFDLLLFFAFFGLHSGRRGGLVVRLQWRLHGEYLLMYNIPNWGILGTAMAAQMERLFESCCCLWIGCVGTRQPRWRCIAAMCGQVSLIIAPIANIDTVTFPVHSFFLPLIVVLFVVPGLPLSCLKNTLPWLLRKASRSSIMKFSIRNLSSCTVSTKMSPTFSMVMKTR